MAIKTLASRFWSNAQDSLAHWSRQVSGLRAEAAQAGLHPRGLSFIVLMVSICLAGCAANRAMRYPPTQPVLFEGVQFQVFSSTFTTEFRNFVGQPSTPQASFLIVELGITNRLSDPLEYTFQPLFRLQDERGTLFSPSDHHTIAINMGQTAGNFLDDLNPGVTVRRKIVFDVPVQKYDLRVIVPREATAGLLGSGTMNVRGRYFAYDLPLTEVHRPGRIGIQWDPARRVIAAVAEGSAGARAGLSTGDVLLEIDGTPVGAASYPEIVNLLSGPAGSQVRLKIRRGVEMKMITVVRE